MRNIDKNMYSQTDRTYDITRYERIKLDQNKKN